MISMASQPDTGAVKKRVTRYCSITKDSKETCARYVNGWMRCWLALAHFGL